MDHLITPPRSRQMETSRQPNSDLFNPQGLRYSKPGKLTLGVSEAAIIDPRTSGPTELYAPISGCSAVAVEGIEPSGLPVAMLTHYMPTHLEAHISRIVGLGQLRNLESGTAEVFVPYEHQQQPDGRYEKVTPDSARRLCDAVKEAFGDSVSIEVKPYQEGESPGRIPGVSVDFTREEKIQGHFG